MDLSARLSAAEIEALSDPELPLSHVLGLIKGSRKGLAGDAGLAFEEGLRLKNTLDEYEEKALSQPSWEVLAVVVNCEYQLYACYEDIALRHHPFLSHWIDTVEKLGHQLRKLPDSISVLPHMPRSRDVLNARLDIIARILQAENRSQLDALDLTPWSLSCLDADLDFNLQPYRRMLQEEGIFDEDVSVAESHTDDMHQTQSPANITNGVVVDRAQSKDRQDWRAEIVGLLRTHREQGIARLTHMPVDLPSLDFLTTLLEEKTLQSLSIEPSPVLSDFLQRSLRTIELMTEPPDPDIMYSDGVNGLPHLGEVPDGGGRRSQERAVGLLLLFIRNAITKELLPVQDIFYEIQEICVRYIFMREVREFRAFVFGENELAESEQ